MAHRARWRNETRTDMSDTVETVLRALLAAVTVIAAAYLSFLLLQKIAQRYSERYPALISLVEAARRPFRVLVALIAAGIVSTLIADVPEDWVDAFDQGLQIGIIVALTWLAVAAVDAIESQILKNDKKRDRGAVDRRRFDTQITLLRRLIVASIIAIGVVAVLLTFPSVRSIGTTLVASAGLISIIAGLAAQTSLTNVFAGIQLALSDSIRVGDVMVVNSQIGSDTTDTTGTVTQLTLTHVELRLWDGRILILPSAYFIVQPFENLTQNRTMLIGTISIDVDWSTPIDKIRTELHRILVDSKIWDGRREFVMVSALVGANRTLQIGMSAANMENLVELQAIVREQLTDYLMKELPESLVRTRTQPLTEPTPPPEPADEHHSSSLRT
jgi:small-conductance mechanosensitive channel